METKKYLVQTPIKDGEKRLVAGSAVELTEEAARPLLACGAIFLAPTVPATATALGDAAPAAPKGKKG